MGRKVAVAYTVFSILAFVALVSWVGYTLYQTRNANLIATANSFQNVKNGVAATLTKTHSLDSATFRSFVRSLFLEDPSIDLLAITNTDGQMQYIFARDSSQLGNHRATAGRWEGTIHYNKTTQRLFSSQLPLPSAKPPLRIEMIFAVLGGSSLYAIARIVLLVIISFLILTGIMLLITPLMGGLRAASGAADGPPTDGPSPDRPSSAEARSSGVPSPEEPLPDAPSPEASSIGARGPGSTPGRPSDDEAPEASSRAAGPFANRTTDDDLYVAESIPSERSGEPVYGTSAGRPSDSSSAVEEPFIRHVESIADTEEPKGTSSAPSTGSRQPLSPSEEAAAEARHSPGAKALEPASTFSVEKAQAGHDLSERASMSSPSRDEAPTSFVAPPVPNAHPDEAPFEPPLEEQEARAVSAPFGESEESPVQSDQHSLRNGPLAVEASEQREAPGPWPPAPDEPSAPTRLFAANGPPEATAPAAPDDAGVSSGSFTPDEPSALEPLEETPDMGNTVETFAELEPAEEPADAGSPGAISREAAETEAMPGHSTSSLPPARSTGEGGEYRPATEELEDIPDFQDLEAIDGRGATQPSEPKIPPVPPHSPDEEETQPISSSWPHPSPLPGPESAPPASSESTPRSESRSEPSSLRELPELQRSDDLVPAGPGHGAFTPVDTDRESLPELEPAEPLEELTALDEPELSHSSESLLDEPNRSYEEHSPLREQPEGGMLEAEFQGELGPSSIEDEFESLPELEPAPLDELGLGDDSLAPTSSNHEETKGSMPPPTSPSEPSAPSSEPSPIEELGASDVEELPSIEGLADEPEQRPAMPRSPDGPHKDLFNPETGLAWGDHVDQRLSFELDRSAAFDQDLAVALLRFVRPQSSVERRSYAREIRGNFPFHDLCFEYGDDAFLLAFPNTDIDQAIRAIENFAAKMSEKRPGMPRVYVGIAARNGRLLAGERLLREAESAERKARKDGRNAIFALRVDPGRYREFIKSTLQ